MFVWARIPDFYKEKSMEFSLEILEKSNVAISPGIGFGNSGEGFIRIALVENKQRIRQAMRNMQSFFDDNI
jgi:alanine-synthesizing transaminase